MNSAVHATNITGVDHMRYSGQPSPAPGRSGLYARRCESSALRAVFPKDRTSNEQSQEIGRAPCAKRNIQLLLSFN